MHTSRLAALAALLITVVGVAPARAADPDQPKIVHGVVTSTAENPWQALLVIHGQFLCGGELISPTVVLTAAHCLADADGDPTKVQVFLGRDRTDRGGTALVASSMVINPGYQPKRLAFDWGYVTLSSPAPAGTTPIQIAGPDETALWATGTHARVSGYGTIAEKGPLSSSLRQVTVPILDDAACDRSASYGGRFVPAAMLCAGDPQAGKDSCQGDSGGPLVVRADDGSPRLAGIVSFGRGCAEPGFPGIYTRIADPVLSSELLAQLDGQPATAGYPYLGAGGACGTATRRAVHTTRMLGHAQRLVGRADRTVQRARERLVRARHHLRAHPSTRTRRAVAAAYATEVAAARRDRADRHDLQLARKATRNAADAQAEACA